MSPPDPIARFRELYARAGEVLDKPDAMSLATVDANGHPSVRIVLLKGVDERGFVFYTNLDSPKAIDLRGNPRAALCFHWDPIGEQVRIRGSVEPVPEAEADAYFASRPRGSQLGAWASQQSEPIASREQLMAQVAEIGARFGAGPVPRPPFWSGFRLAPESIEFWTARADRLHDRTLYTREGSGWRTDRLQP